jgi:hypothetical protein
MALKLKRPDSEISLSKIPDPGSPTHVSESFVTISTVLVLKFLLISSKFCPVPYRYLLK